MHESERRRLPRGRWVSEMTATRTSEGVRLVPSASDGDNDGVLTATPRDIPMTPLGVPGFRTLAAAYSINELGNWLGDIALAVLVYDHTKSALATALLFVGTRFVPAFAAPLVVSRIERLRPRPALAALYGLDALVFATLAV